MRKSIVNWHLTALLSLLFLFSGNKSTKGQEFTSFSGDSTRLEAEMNQWFGRITAGERKIIAPDLDRFFSYWTGHYFNGEEKKAIYAVFNALVQKKVTPYPDFSGYINVINTFLATSQPREHFLPWHSIMIRLLKENPINEFTQLIQSSQWLFKDKLLYNGLNVKWKHYAGTYTFISDDSPLIALPVADLSCYSEKDSIRISGTRGIYNLVTREWTGEGGLVDWRKAGEDPGEVFAELSRYRIRMRLPGYSADSVRFTHRRYFRTPLTGRVEDKVEKEVSPDKAAFPKFSNYNTRISIPSLYQDVDYEGAFNMEGRTILGTQSAEGGARLFFKRKGQHFLTAESVVYVITPEKVNTSSAAVTIYHETDSLYHAGIKMHYNTQTRELSLVKDERAIRYPPWYDSFHNVDIYCEAVYYKMGDSLVSIQSMKGLTKDSRVVFESGHYYTERRYLKLQGVSEVNPLYQISSWAEKNKTRILTRDDFAHILRSSADVVENQILDFADWGFLTYDKNRKEGRLKEKLFDYVKAAAKRSDYDEIVFNSFVANASNGLLNLRTFDLQLRGVEKVVLSQAQTVEIMPANKDLVLKKGMNFTFSGTVIAGMFDFHATDCDFQYAPFRINMPDVDSMVYYVFEKEENPGTGMLERVRVRTAVHNLSGTLLIDDPGNKSGLKSFPRYPVFTNNDSSFVYWDSRSVLNGSYDRERFFYRLNPFTIENLDYVETDTLMFSGKLISAGILPVIEEPLHIRPDYSLGLVKKADSGGMPVYNGQGTLFADIDLSNKGLRSNGRLETMNSESVSPDFLLLPDSMVTVAKSFDIREQVSPFDLPQVHGDSVRQVWRPEYRNMTVSTIQKPLAMYRNQSGFSGTLSVKPDSLNGNGKVMILDAVMESRGFKFRSRSFDALIADFRIKSYDLTANTIETQNYQTHFDFDQRKGEFKSNVGISKVNFPINQYACLMDRFDWLIDNEEIMLANERELADRADTLSLSQLIDVGYTGSEFVSTHPRQDSLRFFAARARYHLRSNIINAEEVRIIKVADAAVFPDSGKVVIGKDAQMNVFHRAILIANTQSRYHQFYNADISIASRNYYTGQAMYDYLDRTGKRQKIFFDKIRVDTDGKTIADGTISDSAGFLLSPEFAFQGGVTLYADQKHLLFNGGFHPVTTCLEASPQWVSFQSAINPDSVRIPLSVPLQNIKRKPLQLALLYKTRENLIGASFFRPRIHQGDSVLCTSEGFIEYNIPTNEFRIASGNKLNNVAEPGPYLSFNTWNCKMRGEGSLYLGLNFNPVTLESFGTVDYYTLADSALIRCALTLSFPFGDAAMQRMADHLNSVNLQGVKLTGTNYSMFMERYLPEAEFRRLRGELDLLGRFRKIPDELERQIVFADLPLHYDTLSRSYTHRGNIGIATLGKNHVNKYVKAIVEFSKKRNGDEFSIYLELTSNDWYYFNYRNQLLSVASSDIAFNDLVKEADQSSREQKKFREFSRNYLVSLVSERKKQEFLRKFQSGEEE